MPGCAPGHDAITGRAMKVNIAHDSLSLVAKKVGMTMHQYMRANKETVFVVEYGWVSVTYNKHPNGNCEYVLTP
jgi:hypothetical protein